MKKQFYWLSVLGASFCLGACGDSEETAVIKVNAETLMHEVRATSVPFDGATVKINPPRFMWPDKFPHLGPVLDGVPGTVDEKHTALYRIRISQDKEFKKDVITGEQPWSFFNPFKRLANGTWYWQHAYVSPEGVEEWSPVRKFTVDDTALDFNPPSFKDVLSRYSSQHHVL